MIVIGDGGNIGWHFPMTGRLGNRERMGRHAVELSGISMMERRIRKTIIKRED